jgi:hypothetical protein
VLQFVIYNPYLGCPIGLQLRPRFQWQPIWHHVVVKPFRLSSYAWWQLACRCYA